MPARKRVQIGGTENENAAGIINWCYQHSSLSTSRMPLAVPHQHSSCVRGCTCSRARLQHVEATGRPAEEAELLWCDAIVPWALVAVQLKTQICGKAFMQPHIMGPGTCRASWQTELLTMCNIGCLSAGDCISSSRALSTSIPQSHCRQQYTYNSWLVKYSRAAERYPTGLL